MDQTEINIRAAKVLVDSAASRLAVEPGYQDAVVKLEQVGNQIERDLRQYEHPDELEDDELDEAEVIPLTPEPVSPNGE